jgi:uncharacterized membrane protein YozB (DUF420 family)
MLQFSCVKNMIGVSKIIIFQRIFLTEKKERKKHKISVFFIANLFLLIFLQKYDYDYFLKYFLFRNILK